MVTKSDKIIFVGLSGGVDSSVTAKRLKQEGYNVVGVFIKVWHPDFLECDWESERLDAMRVSAHLDIPFLTCDASEAYEKEVSKNFISEYKAGRTPNPDVLCNQFVKFGEFLKFAKKFGANLIATGHYAQNHETQDGQHKLLRGKDNNKDQSYFLWTLTNEQLKHVLFPIGDSKKLKIRKEAKKAELQTSQKKDSQGICFLGHIDIPEFLSHYVDLKKGDVLDIEGNVIGQHQGALVYTTGQRHGFNIDKKTDTISAHYVLDKNILKNTITVTTIKPITEDTSHLTLHSINLITQPKVGDKLYAQLRYRQKPILIIIKRITLETIDIELLERTEAYANGQSCVLYTYPNNTECIGGGIIQS